MFLQLVRVWTIGMDRNKRRSLGAVLGDPEFAMWITVEGMCLIYSAKSIACQLMPAWHHDSGHCWYSTQIFLPDRECDAAVGVPLWVMWPFLVLCPGELPLENRSHLPGATSLDHPGSYTTTPSTGSQGLTINGVQKHQVRATPCSDLHSTVLSSIIF